MSEQDPQPQPPAKQPHRWQKGQPSPNPKGRPRNGLAFAERVRERIDPDLIIDLAIKVAEDETLSPATRLAALWPLIDRGFIKPPTTIAAHVQTSAGDLMQHARALTDEQLDELDELDRRADAIFAIPLLNADAHGSRSASLIASAKSDGHRVTDPKVLDGEMVLLPAPVAPRASISDEE